MRTFFKTRFGLCEARSLCIRRGLTRTIVPLSILTALFAQALAGFASDARPPDHSQLTVNRIFGQKEFKTEDWGPAHWLNNGSGYTTPEPSKQVKGAKDIVRYDPQTGRREVLVSASQLVPHGKSKPLSIDGYAWSDDTRKLLIFINTKRVWRLNTRGDYWVFDRDSGKLQKLGGAAESSTLMFTTFSPDGSRVAYVCRRNLYVQTLASLRITALTTNGSETLINGTSDWVNEEEFHLRKGFRWSPDGRHLAYWQFDTTRVPDFELINYTDSLYPTILTYPYPMAGQTNSACRVGVVAADGGATRWFDTGADPRNHYIPQMEWVPNSRAVLFQQLNRIQNTNLVIRGDVKTGRTKVVFTDRDEAWVDVSEDWHWIQHGKRFLWLSERDGWRHLYAVSRSGQEVKLLTPGKYDVISVAGVDEKHGWIYLIASPENPTQCYLYRVSLQNGGNLTRLTPAEQCGTHSYAHLEARPLGHPHLLALWPTAGHRSRALAAASARASPG